jgi:formate dehydrogenase maturation protein FdhE
MTFLASSRVSYSARIARAELLSARLSFASEILAFYLKVASFQKTFYENLPKLLGKRRAAPNVHSFHAEVDFLPMADQFGDFLSLIRTTAPSPLSSEATKLLSQGKSVWANSLQSFWKTGLFEAPKEDEESSKPVLNPLQEFLARGYLQPYAEFIVASMLPPNLPMTVCRCPRCNSLPLLGVLRPEGDGGKRFLQCALCSQEWEFRRILCAFCGEEREDHLPVFVSEQLPHIRVESCQTCKRYLRTIDLTKDGNAVPLVDDLSAVPLGLWANEQGLRRIQSNLLGT